MNAKKDVKFKSKGKFQSLTEVQLPEKSHSSSNIWSGSKSHFPSKTCSPPGVKQFHGENANKGNNESGSSKVLKKSEGTGAVLQ